MTLPAWLSVVRGDAPLLLSMPHAGTELAGLESRFVSPWLARRDTDWWIPEVYSFAAELGVTVVRTRISRSVIDVNRDPSGQSLYPGQATTGLCPSTTFDGEALYPPGNEPTDADIEARRGEFFDPYHAALSTELARLRAQHPRVVLYDCHSIRSVIPRLFDGVLPVFNLGTNSGASADAQLTAQVQAVLQGSGQSHVVNGRFRGGWITRSHGQPAQGLHALQMEMACRAYMPEPEGPPTQDNWPTAFDPVAASRTRDTLRQVLQAALDWARATL